MYLVSLPLVGFHARVTCCGYGTLDTLDYRGYEILLTGWLGVLDGTIAWYANPLLALALATIGKKGNTSLWLSGAGLFLALSTFFYRKTWIDERYASYANVDTWGLGFYL